MPKKRVKRGGNGYFYPQKSIRTKIEKSSTHNCLLKASKENHFLVRHLTVYWRQKYGSGGYFQINWKQQLNYSTDVVNAIIRFSFISSLLNLIVLTLANLVAKI